jgi:hypothetical protein
MESVKTRLNGKGIPLTCNDEGGEMITTLRENVRSFNKNCYDIANHSEDI